MALIPTGRANYTSDDGSGSSSDVEYIDDVTGVVSWAPGSGANQSDVFSTEYFQTLQHIGNNQTGGPQGTLSEAAATIDPRGTMANVIRGMSDDFFKTAIPVKNDLIKTTTYNGNTGVIDGLRAQGMQRVGKTFDNARREADINSSQYGMKLTSDQQNAQQRALASGKALAEVDTLNRATQFQNDLNKQLVSGMGSTVGITK